MGDLRNIGKDADNVRNMISVKPFRLTALEYHRRGWIPFPLPPRDKYPPPEGTTGKKNPVPEDRLEAVTTYLADGFQARVDGRSQHFEADVCNIGLRMDHNVIGIDVDHYEAKHGADELAVLEKKLGKLPVTWTSSARTDGHSGIRFFRIPKKYLPGSKLGGAHGLSFSGKAANAIDVVQYSHRYTAAPPSYHPDVQAEYRWFAPGEPLDQIPSGYRVEIRAVNVSRSVVGTAIGVVDQGGARSTHMAPFVKFVEKKTTLKIPYVDELPDLPDAWIQFLSRGYVRDDLKARDITSSERELLSWAAKNFPGGKSAQPCKTVRKATETHKERMKTGESSHDKIVEMHWNIYNYALEGHRGSLLSSARLEKLWTRTVLKGNTVHGQKRHLTEASGEVFRSRVEALRKIKGMADEVFEDGGNPFKTGCTCFDEDAADKAAEEAGVSAGPKPTGKALDPGEYERNDDGNANHLMDLYGEDLKFVPGFGKWIFWNGERWLQDEDGLARRCYRRVKDRQDAYALQLLNIARERLAAAGGDSSDPEFKEAKGKAESWRKWAESSGNNVRANGAVEAARSNFGVTVQAEALDANVRLLAVDNGIVELLETGIKFRPATREDYVVTNTGVPFIPLRDQFQRGGDMRKGVELWNDYLKLFLPDPDIRFFFQKAMGYCLFGRNIERLGIFLHGPTSTGKSTALSAIMSAMGEYASPVEMSIFKDKDLNPGLAQAMPRRIITTTEAGAQNFLHADTFKRMTGGDAMSAELKGVNTIIRRVPAFVPVIATNSPPTIRGADKALEKRLLIIPFDTQITEEKDQKQASQNLHDSASTAVLGWLVEGWVAYAKEGLPISSWPKQVQERTKEFSHSLNDIGEFLQDCIEFPNHTITGTKGEAEWRVPLTQMYDAFYHWATIVQRIPERDIYTLTGFGKRLVEQGIEKKTVFMGVAEDTGKTRTAKAWVGVKLKESTENVVNGKFRSYT